MGVRSEWRRMGDCWKEQCAVFPARYLGESEGVGSQAGREGGARWLLQSVCNHWNHLKSSSSKATWRISMWSYKGKVPEIKWWRRHNSYGYFASKQKLLQKALNTNWRQWCTKSSLYVVDRFWETVTLSERMCNEMKPTGAEVNWHEQEFGS